MKKFKYIWKVMVPSIGKDFTTWSSIGLSLLQLRNTLEALNPYNNGFYNGNSQAIIEVSQSHTEIFPQNIKLLTTHWNKDTSKLNIRWDGVFGKLRALSFVDRVQV